jgi:NitT/TauT family transport system permease protein
MVIRRKNTSTREGVLPLTVSLAPYKAYFAPNHHVSQRALQTLVIGETLIVLTIWVLNPGALLPSPWDILKAIGSLYSNGLVPELLTSLYLNVQAMALACVISLGLAYLSVIPAMRPLILFISKLRFLSMAGLTFVFTIMATSGHELKLSLLVFTVSVFFVTSMMDVVASAPQDEFDLARTLKMGEWRVVWEVIVLGRLDQAFDALRQNAAMSWMMLTFVESVVRSEGGIGAVLIDQNRHFHLDAVFAIQFVILFLGLAQDQAIAWVKTIVCPYAALTLERK